MENPRRLKKKLLILALLGAGLAVLGTAGGPAPAWARPCCSDCDSYPYLDPNHDPCARVCAFNC